MEDLWVWQGFFGPAEAANAAKVVADATPDDVIGVVVPPRGAPCVAVDDEGEVAMFAVQTRPAAPWPVPEGLKPARADIVGRLVGA